VSPRKKWSIVAAAVLVLGLVVFVVVALTRPDGDVEAVGTTSTTSTTAASTTTVPTEPAPLTGLPVDPSLVGRTALVVKLDNAEGLARPQAGINQADVVIEEKVEGNISRFFAVFQSTEADSIGPVRSARSTDVHLVGPFNRPLFAYSGANQTFLSLVRAAPLVDVGYDAYPADYLRVDGRRAPHNLFTSSAALWAHTPEGAGPPLAFAPFDEARSAPTGVFPAQSVGFVFGGGGARVEYRWDAAEGVWKRWQNGTEHVDADGVQVAPANVIVQYVRYVNTSTRDSAGNPVPEAETVGSGEALVFVDGTVIGGGWSRASEDAATTFTDSSGQPVVLRPGRTWVALVPVGLPVEIG
jgi:hypothetical protein